MRMPPPAKRGEINFSFIDRFTFVHLSIGIIYAFMGLSFFVTLELAIFWEVIENPLKAYIPQIFPHATADTWKNSLGDSLAVCFGWATITYA